MASIPLEDNFTDIVGKAQRGLKLSDQQLIQQAGITAQDFAALRAGTVDEQVLGKIAPPLGLGKKALLESARKSWTPQAHQISGLFCFNTQYEDMTVNSYVVGDQKSHTAVVFDTGADATPMLDAARRNNLQIKLILLTHTHVDHVAYLKRLQAETKAPVHVCELESIPAAQSFREGQTFNVGGLKIETRQTSGHSKGGITYVISGLSRPVAIVGDSLFAGSMGGGGISYADALANNRKKVFSLPNDTILCPGHGPLTTVVEEKMHNPFYLEFQN